MQGWGKIVIVMYRVGLSSSLSCAGWGKDHRCHVQGWGNAIIVVCRVGVRPSLSYAGFGKRHYFRVQGCGKTIIVMRRVKEWTYLSCIWWMKSTAVLEKPL